MVMRAAAGDRSRLKMRQRSTNTKISPEEIHIANYYTKKMKLRCGFVLVQSRQCQIMQQLFLG